MLYKEVVVDDKMMPALSGINTLSKEKSVFLCIQGSRGRLTR